MNIQINKVYYNISDHSNTIGLCIIETVPTIIRKQQ